MMAARRQKSKPRPSPASIAALAPHRAPVDRVWLILPTPPSVNALHTLARGRMILSDAYRAWKEEAGWRLLSQRPGRIVGQYELAIWLCAKETKIDADNGIKAISDLLQAHGVIDNDRKAESVDITWGSPSGALVSVTAVTG